MFVGYLTVTAILDLTNKKDIHTFKADDAVEILVIEHSVNGIIPLGKDHYYLGVDENTDDACVIKASPGWYKKNFDDNGHAVSSGGITVTALSKKARKFEVEQELAARVSAYEGINLTVPPNYPLELGYRLNAILKLVMLVLTVAMFFWGKRIVDSKEDRNPTEVKIFAAVLIIVLILLLKVLM